MNITYPIAGSIAFYGIYSTLGPRDGLRDVLLGREARGRGPRMSSTTRRRQVAKEALKITGGRVSSRRPHYRGWRPGHDSEEPFECTVGQFI